MRICLVYDCLYPYTVGGAERWYRNLAERLVADGHEVTYLTRRQWQDRPDVLGVHVVAVAPRMELYARGRRRLLPPLLFGAGVFWHLLRHGRRYDVVHTASFPYFSVLGASGARRRAGFRIVVDWHEVWTRGYWHSYAGRAAGELGWRVQRTCMRVPQRAFCFSRLHEQRLREEGLTARLIRLEGEYAGPPPPAAPRTARDVVVFAGRHLAEKRVPSLVEALARIPELGGEIYGDGPDRLAVLAAIREHGLESRVSAPGLSSVASSTKRSARRSASCCRPSGRVTASLWSSRPRRACRSSSSRAGERSDGARRGRHQRRGGAWGRRVGRSNPARARGRPGPAQLDAGLVQVEREPPVARELAAARAGGLRERRFVGRDRLRGRRRPGEPRGVHTAGGTKPVALGRVREQALDGVRNRPGLLRVE